MEAANRWEETEGMDDLPIEEILLIARKYGVTSVRVFGSRARGDAGPTSDLDPSEAHRKIEVVASDELRFDPAAVDVSVGEVVTFGVRNDGDNSHEFVLGDDDYQVNARGRRGRRRSYDGHGQRGLGRAG